MFRGWWETWTGLFHENTAERHPSHRGMQFAVNNTAQGLDVQFSPFVNEKRCLAARNNRASPPKTFVDHICQLRVRLPGSALSVPLVGTSAKKEQLSERAFDSGTYA
jgi:hypothetical protein